MVHAPLGPDLTAKLYDWIDEIEHEAAAAGARDFALKSRFEELCRVIQDILQDREESLMLNTLRGVVAELEDHHITEVEDPEVNRIARDALQNMPLPGISAARTEQWMQRALRRAFMRGRSVERGQVMEILAHWRNARESVVRRRGLRKLARGEPMNDLERLVLAIQHELREASVALDRPGPGEGEVWFADVTYGDRRVSIEWSEETGFAIGSKSGESFSMPRLNGAFFKTLHLLE